MEESWCFLTHNGDDDDSVFLIMRRCQRWTDSNGEACKVWDREDER